MNTFKKEKEPLFVSCWRRAHAALCVLLTYSHLAMQEDVKPKRSRSKKIETSDDEKKMVVEKERPRPESNLQSAVDQIRDQLSYQLSDEFLPEVVGLDLPRKYNYCSSRSCNQSSPRFLFRSLYDLLEKSITNRESFSAMIVGFRGSGKSVVRLRPDYDLMSLSFNWG